VARQSGVNNPKYVVVFDPHIYWSCDLAHAVAANMLKLETTAHITVKCNTLYIKWYRLKDYLILHKLGYY